ncbi:MAG: hypothetical protein GY943_13790 [Chloroflexi bacterium]|nr:hypothetical protein [Chloroflexota bacterium]
MKADKAKKEEQVINITLPQNLVQRLFNHIQPDQLSQFVADAVEQRLVFEELFEALDETTKEWFVDKRVNDILPEDEFVSWLREDGRFWNRPHQ